MSETAPSYEARREAFSWDEYWEACDWDARERLNFAHEVVDKHVDDADSSGESVALYWRDADGNEEEITFGELARDSNRFANVLEDIGVTAGDRVFTYLPRIPEHYTVLLGTLKTGAIFGAINERYGVDGINHRLSDSRAQVVVTTPENRGTIVDATTDVESVEHVIVVPVRGGGVSESDIDYAERMGNASEAYETTPMAPDDPAFLYYTSGTTGPAKGVVHAHRLIVNIAAFGQQPIDLREGDLFWCTADLGWLTGLIPFGALFWGVPAVVYDGEFDPQRWTTLLDEYPITVLFSVPTAFRMLKEKDDLLSGAELDVRTILSVGEPLNPAVVEWSRDRFGTPILDTYGTSENFGEVITNYPFDGWEVNPGSMGRPYLGIDVTLVEPGTTNEVEQGETGEIAIGSFPGQFLRYWERDDETEETFRDGWVLTDDLARRDDDGYFWFQGRADDVILSAGYRIGPFDIESTLVDHDAVAEAAAVPEPDEERGNVVKGVIVLSAGFEPSDDLRADIKSYVRERLAAHEYPRELEFVDELPKTVTGKIRRKELRE